MTRVLMVCLGNICRSPLAHGILQSKLPSHSFFIDSAGTGNYHIGSAPDKRSIEVAKSNGIDISKQRCRQFGVSDFDAFDIIYVMDESNYKDVLKIARHQDDISKVKLILHKVEAASSTDVPDPYWGNQEDFEYVFNLLHDACENIAKQLQKQN